MKIQNKITALILCLLMLCQTVYALPKEINFFDEEPISESKITLIQKLLVKTGVMSSVSDSDFKEGTAAEISDLIDCTAALLGKSVTDYDKAYKELYDRGCFYSETMPNYVSLGDALYTFVRLIGCAGEAEYSGGYPTGYMNTAQNHDLLKNLQVKDADKITRGELAILAFNALNAPVNAISGQKNGNFVFKEGDSILLSRFNIEKKRGIVTAAGITTLYGSSDLHDGYVEVDRFRYETSDESIADYLGYNVEMYIESDGDTKMIVCFEPHKNNVYEGDISSDAVFENTFLRYTDESGKDRKVKISKAKVIYNNMILGDYDAIDKSLLDTVATFTAVDNDNDSYADVICVWDYEYLRVGTIGEDAMTFAHLMKYKDKDSIRLDDNNIAVTVIKDGTKASVSALEYGDVVAVAESAAENAFGRKCITFVVSKDSASGKIESVSSDDKGYIVRVNGKDYRVSKNYEKICGLDGANVSRKDIVKPTIGQTVTLYLAHDGTVADISENSMTNIAYLVKTYTDDESEKCFVRLFKTDGTFELFTLADKVRYFGKATNYTDGKKEEDSAVVEYIKGEAKQNGDYRAVVFYEQNDSGEISKLYMPYNRVGEAPGTVNYPNTFDYTSNNESASKYYYKGLIGRLYDNPKRYYSAWTTPMFIVPSFENKDNDDEYAMRTQEYFGRADITLPQIELYNTNQFYEASLALSRSEVGDAPKEGTQPFIISKVTMEYDDKTVEERVKIIGYEKGKEKTYYIPQKVDSTSSDNLKIFTKDLKCGDVCQIDASGESVNSIRLLARLADFNGTYDVKWKLKKIQTENSYGTIYVQWVEGNLKESNSTVFSSLVKNGENENMPVTFESLGGNSNLHCIYIYEKGKVRKGEISEIRKGDSVWIYQNYGFSYAVCAVR